MDQRLRLGIAAPTPAQTLTPYRPLPTPCLHQRRLFALRFRAPSPLPPASPASPPCGARSCKEAPCTRAKSQCPTESAAAHRFPARAKSTRPCALLPRRISSSTSGMQSCPTMAKSCSLPGLAHRIQHAQRARIRCRGHQRPLAAACSAQQFAHRAAGWPRACRGPQSAQIDPAFKSFNRSRIPSKAPVMRFCTKLPASINPTPTTRSTLPFHLRCA